jgi:hypothetical protein
VAEREYRRLTRSSAVRKRWFVVAFATRESLWLGKDHLLSVTSNRFFEEYKRFFFRDIQAMTLRRTRRREILNLILSLLLLLSIALLVSQGRTNGFSRGLWPWAIPAIFVALPLVVNNILGPACTCYIRTAVQVEELPSLNRFRRAHRIVESIRPLIVAAQGELTAEQLSSGLQELARADAAAQISRRMVTSPLNLS